ncbi:MAG: Uma2 family endonuclease [bacterium]
MKSLSLKNRENRPKLSYRDYVLFPDNGKRHEIIDGDHFMSPSPSTRHQRISRNLAIIIASFLREQELGELFYAPCDVILSDHDIVVPDLIYVSNQNKGIITEDNIQGPPDLIVEILSPSTRSYDQVLKKDLYEAFGVKEYWIIDPDKETVEIYRLSAGRFPGSEIHSRSQVLKAGIIPGLEIPLDKVFSPAGR